MGRATMKDIDGFMTNIDLNVLTEWASRFSLIVEIGSWKGKSTQALLAACPGKVIAIDHFKGSANQIDTVHKEAKTADIYKQFHDNVGHFENLSVMRMDSRVAANLFAPKSIDMVFIDGSHEYKEIYADLIAWERVCKTMLCGDDVWEDGVPKALHDAGIKYHFVNGTSLWYSMKEG